MKVRNICKACVVYHFEDNTDMFFIIRIGGQESIRKSVFSWGDHDVPHAICEDQSIQIDPQYQLPVAVPDRPGLLFVIYFSST